MTATATPSSTTATTAAPPLSLISRLVTMVLGIKPVFNVAKHQARAMMVKRAASIGVDWPGEVAALRSRRSLSDIQTLSPQSQTQLLLNPIWEAELAKLRNDNLVYPDYYLQSFHAYEEGNMGWQPAFEADVAGKTVHAKIWAGAGAKGDAQLRQSYHDVIKRTLPTPPQDIVDIGCSAGHSTLALRSLYPQAHCTGVELSPYFLTVAQYREAQYHQATDTRANRNINDAHPQYPIHWVHGAGEATGLASASFDLASICLVIHELPRAATQAIIAEMRRLLKPGGYLAIMDMNPQAEIYATMPPYILTLLKSTEPFLDDYFSFDLEQALVDEGFSTPTITRNSPRHRTVMAQIR
ncbi:MAG: methyltransferase domain-containing protein [Merismopedia sp. SIO2A8]|nr:methyltransferase domain-containing protein [Merismopedia sp. SIO2A8]